VDNIVSDIDFLILCGGEGQRLKTIAQGAPKPMMPVKNRPFLDYLIEHIFLSGGRRIILLTGYQKELIKEYYTNSPFRKKLEIEFSEENTPLGTGGALRQASSLIHSSDFFVINGDTFCEIHFHEMLKFHLEKKSRLTIAVTEANDRNDVGVLKVNQTTYRVEGFSEKRIKEEGSPKWVNTGVYLMNQWIFDFFPQRKEISLEYDVFPNCVLENTYGYPFFGKFIDIGIPERYHAALSLF
jgi:NDP-sugar pyrophosphorylase family protein